MKFVIFIEGGDFCWGVVEEDMILDVVVIDERLCIFLEWVIVDW